MINTWEIPMAVQSSKGLQRSSDLSCVCVTQCPVWDLGCDLPCSSVLKVFAMLFRMRATQVQYGDEPKSLEQYGALLSQASPSLWSPWHFLVAWGPLSWFSSQKDGALFILLCYMPPATGSVSRANWWKKRERIKAIWVPSLFENTVPLTKKEGYLFLEF